MTAIAVLEMIVGGLAVAFIAGILVLIYVGYKGAKR